MASELMPPTTPSRDHCSGCANWMPIGESPAPAGYCLRYPPVPRFGTYVGQPGSGVPKIESYYPETLAGWWCAEWKAPLPVAETKPG